MIEYFKLLENFLKDCSIQYNDIKDLTFKLMDSGGYYRGTVKFLNGSERERTLYSKKFDSYLVALWLCFYKNLFISKLLRHPELEEYHVFIINKTFYMVLNSLNKDKIVDNNIINRYVNMTLSSRIKEVMYIKKSTYNLSPYKKGKNTFRLKNTVDNRAISIDNIDKLTIIDETSDLSGDNKNLEIDLRNCLNDSIIGNRLLDAMLYSGKRFTNKKIDEYIGLERYECTEDTKKQVAESFNIIKKALISYSNYNVKRFKPIKFSSLKYSFEK